MKGYKNLSGKSGVSAYAMADDAILVEFRRGAVYLYTDDSIGQSKRAKMQELAQSGQGLNAFINQNVRADFARKLT